MAGLAMTALANSVNRKLLGFFFERTVFHRDNRSPIDYLTDLPTASVRLDEQNLYDAVLASGSIPMVLDAVENISGANGGRYFDGGVTDYHFALPFESKGLVLFPHFYPHSVPGWFDKALPWRKQRQPAGSNVLMICPSDEWVASLPFGKIPDRHDFATMDDHQRTQYWDTVVNRSHELSEERNQLISGPRSWSDYLLSQAYDFVAAPDRQQVGYE